MKFQSPYFSQVLDYWQSLCTTDSIPNAAKFDLIEVAPALPDITFWELSPEGQIVCRMAGTLVVERMKSDITGRDLLDLMPEDARSMARDDFRTMLSYPCGGHCVQQNRHVTGKIVRLEAVSLPLAGGRNGSPKFVTVNHMINSVGYDSEPADDQMELGRSFEERGFFDVGWGVPETPDQQARTLP